VSCEWLGLRHARLDIICRDARGWDGGIRDKLAARMIHIEHVGAFTLACGVALIVGFVLR
jgi:hypothetical protein